MIVLGRISPVSRWDRGLCWGPSCHLSRTGPSWSRTSIQQPQRLHHSLGAFLCKQTSTLSADCGVGKEPSRDAHDGSSLWCGCSLPITIIIHTSISRLRMAVSGIDAMLFSFHQTASSTHRDENVPMTHWLILLVYKGSLGFRGLC